MARRLGPQKFSASVAWVLGPSAESVLPCTGGRTAEQEAELQNRGQNWIEVAEPQNRGQNCRIGGRTRGELQNKGQMYNRERNCRTRGRTAEHAVGLFASLSHTGKSTV